MNSGPTAPKGVMLKGVLIAISSVVLLLLGALIIFLSLSSLYLFVLFRETDLLYAILPPTIIGALLVAASVFLGKRALNILLGTYPKQGVE